MKKTVHKAIALVLACFLVTSSALAYSDSSPDSLRSVGPQASYQLNQYSVALRNVSRGTMEVSFSVFGTQMYMTKIGAQEIVIEQEITSGVWQECHSFSDYYDTDTSYHIDAIEFSVTPGVRYRATLTAYGEDSRGSDTGTVTSGALRAKT